MHTLKIQNEKISGVKFPFSAIHVPSGRKGIVSAEKIINGQLSYLFLSDSDRDGIGYSKSDAGHAYHKNIVDSGGVWMGFKCFDFEGR